MTNLTPTHITILRAMSGGADELTPTLAMRIGLHNRTTRRALNLLGLAGLVSHVTPQPGDGPAQRWAINIRGLGAIVEHRRQIDAANLKAVEERAAAKAARKAAAKARAAAERAAVAAEAAIALAEAGGNSLLAAMMVDARECNIRAGFNQYPNYGNALRRHGGSAAVPKPRPIPVRERLMAVLEEANGEWLTTKELCAAVGTVRETISPNLAAALVSGKVEKGWGPNRGQGGGQERLWRVVPGHTGPHRGGSEDFSDHSGSQPTCASRRPSSASAGVSQ